MLTAEFKKEVEEIQEMALTNVSKQSRNVKVGQENIFQKILASQDNIVEFGLGKLGIAMKHFAKRADLQHATINFLSNGEFLDTGNLYKETIELLTLAEFALERNLTVIPEEMKQLINSKYNYSIKTLLKPPVSILKEESDRKTAREIPLPKDIANGNKCDMLTWENTLESFKPFVRMGDGFKDQIKYHNKIIKNLESLGITEHAKDVSKQNEEFNNILKDNYCEFVKLSSQEVAIKLAKALCFSVNPDYGRIICPRNNFDFPFWKDTFHATSGWFYYSPHWYPLCKLPVAIPHRVAKIIDCLENHPDANGKPLFDHYYVIVPSVDLVNREDKSSISFYDGTKRRGFSNAWDGNRLLDKILIEEQEIMPVILGESIIEQKVFFICFLA